MKSQFVALAIVLAGLPALAWGQAPCGCSPRSGSVIRPAAYGAWADYQPAGHQDGCGCGSCAPACCTPCCRPLLCIIPDTVRKIGRTLDCLLPCGPRSGHGCGISCIGAGSGCSSISCSSGCPSCSSPAIGNPFHDDEPLPPMPPKPAAQETRRQPSMRAPRQMAAAPAVGSRKISTRPATKSVLTRTSQPSEEVVSRANHMAPAAKKPSFAVKRTSALVPVADTSTESARDTTTIPHNPLR